MNEIALRSVAKYQIEYPERFDMESPLRLTIPSQTIGCIAGNTCVLYLRDRTFRSQCDKFLERRVDVDIPRLQYYLLTRSRYVPAFPGYKKKLYPLWKDTSALASALLGLTEDAAQFLFYFPVTELIDDKFPARSRYWIRYRQTNSSLDKARIAEGFIEAFISFVEKS